MKRQKSREIAMELLFSMELSKNSIEETMEMFIENYEMSLDTIDMDYVRNVVEVTYKNKEEVDAIIEKSMTNWKKERISKVNLSILRLAIAEILYVNDVPGRVAFNEAIELTKKYSDEKSMAFVNAVLDNALKVIEA